MKIDFWIQKKKLDGLTSIIYIYAWSDVGVSTWTPVRWLSKSPCMASFSLSDFTGVAYRNRFRYVMTLKWSTEESDSSDALRIGSTPILFPASIATSSSQNVKLRPLFTQNKIIISNYYSNTESKLDFFNAVVSSIFIEYQFWFRWVDPRNQMLLFQMNSLLAFSRPYCEQMLNYTITLVWWVRQLHF